MTRRSVRTCRKCGCTDADCSGCIERTGVPCYWVEADLCSACVPELQGEVIASTRDVIEQQGCNPIGKTFSFEVTHNGMVRQYSGVPCVVDGDRTIFRLDDSVLVSTRRADP